MKFLLSHNFKKKVKYCFWYSFVIYHDMYRKMCHDKYRITRLLPINTSGLYPCESVMCLNLGGICGSSVSWSTACWGFPPELGSGSTIGRFQLDNQFGHPPGIQHLLENTAGSFREEKGQFGLVSSFSGVIQHSSSLSYILLRLESPKRRSYRRECRRSPGARRS